MNINKDFCFQEKWEKKIKEIRTEEGKTKFTYIRNGQETQIVIDGTIYHVVRLSSFSSFNISSNNCFIVFL